ncbi:hypothetical protein G9O61_00g004150 [Vairimorpha ceranae]|nr:hypothetical protein G9O61_00g004150 [Vairimorpha ceranae]
MHFEIIKHPIYNFKGFKIIIQSDTKPKYRFLNALEQCVENYNTDYLYLVLYLKDKENVGYRIKKCLILEELVIEKYNRTTKMYFIEFYTTDYL